MPGTVPTSGPCATACPLRQRPARCLIPLPYFAQHRHTLCGSAPGNSDSDSDGPGRPCQAQVLRRRPSPPRPRARKPPGHARCVPHRVATTWHLRVNYAKCEEVCMQPTTAGGAGP
eukprot:364088-Chlamydomonas_euryale.AAC.11